MLGSEEPVEHSLTVEGLKITAPKAKSGEHAYVFKIA
jgi:hypothetical protein